jgi:hypothetical protein
MNQSFDKNQPTDKLQTHVPRMLIAIVGLLVLAYYGTVALSTQDALWFTSGYSGKPSRVIVYHDGQRSELQPGERAAIEIADAVEQSLVQGVAQNSGLGFSAGSLEDAYKLYVTLEVFFDQPVKLHATFSTGRPTQMLFPITGRHSDRPLVLLGVNGSYMSDGPVLKTIEPIKTALRRWGYLE